MKRVKFLKLFFIGVAAAIVFTLAVSAVAMAADKYWVGDGGSITDNATHWSDSDGGAPGAALPGLSDDVHFTSNSFTIPGQSVSVGSAFTCKSMDWTNATNNPTLSGSAVLTLYGSITIPNTVTVSKTGTIQISASSTINISGTVPSTFTAIQNGITVSLGNDLTVTGVNGFGLDWTNQTFTTNNYDLTTTKFGATYSGTTLNLGTSSITDSGSWSLNDAATVNANTATVTITGTGGLYAGDVNYNGTKFTLEGTAHTVSGSFTCANLYRIGTATKTDSVTFTSGDTVTITGSLALIGNSPTNRLLVQSSTLGTAATINASSTVATGIVDADVMDITFTNAIAYNTTHITNGNFESGGAPPSNWSNDAATSNTDNVIYYSGSNGANITANGAYSRLQQDIAPYTNVPLEGKVVSATIWARASSANDKSQRILLYDSVGLIEYSAVIPKDDTWHQYTVTGDVNAGATWARIFCSPNWSGTVDTDDVLYVDDAVVTISNTIGDAGGNTNLTATPAVSQTWTGGTGSWSTAGNWDGARVPLPQDDVTVDTTGVTVTVDMPRLGGSISYTGNGTVSLSNDVYNYGSYTLATTLTYTHNGRINYHGGRSSYTLTSGGQTFYGNRLVAPGGSLTLQDNFTNINRFDPIAGTLDDGGYDVTLASFYTYGTLTRGLQMNGTWTLTSTSTLDKWNMDTSSGLTFDAGNSTIIFTSSSSNTQTFDGADQTYHNLTITGTGDYIVKMLDDNIFSTIYVNTTDANKDIEFDDGTTTNVTDFTRDYSSNIVTLVGSGVAGWNLIATTGQPISLDYMSIDYCTASPATTWYFGTHSTDGGNNNANVIFDDPDLTGYISASALSPLTMSRDGVITGTFPGTITTFRGSASLPSSFDWGTTLAYGNNESAGTLQASGGSISATVPTDWVPGTTYHSRAKMTNFNASSPYYSSDVETPLTMPTVVTTDATGQGIDGAGSHVTLNGDITDMGIAGDMYANFHWGYSPGVYPNVTAEQIVSGVSSISVTLDGVTPGQDIYYIVVGRVGATSTTGSEKSTEIPQSISWLLLVSVAAAFGMLVIFVALFSMRGNLNVTAFVFVLIAGLIGALGVVLIVQFVFNLVIK